MSRLLSVKNLKKRYTVQKGFVFSQKIGIVHAVNDVSFYINEGEIFGLVGESGCGKTTTGRIIARLIPADEGEILFRDEDISLVKGKALRQLRRKIQFIFQDPLSSLNPRMPILETLGEPLLVHDYTDWVQNIFSKKKIMSEIREKAVSLLETVGLDSTFLYRFPHQLSGGQRQRVLMARALSLSPVFMVADEPVSALDVSVQARILNLLEELNKKIGFACLFISHDLGVVKNISHRVGVMYAGKIVESAPSEELFNTPKHPYTKGLIRSCCDIDLRGERSVIPGEVPDLSHLPPGCPFHPRCREKMKACSQAYPPYKEVSPHHWVACHLHQI